MRRLAALAVTAVLWPTGLTAQDEILPAPAFSVSAYTGVRVPFHTGFVTVYDAAGTPLFSVEEQRSGNPVLGLEGKARVTGPFSAVVGATYSQTGTGEFFVDRPARFRDQGDFAIRYLSDTWFAKAGVSAHFGGRRRVEDGRRMPSTNIVVAPALVRQFDVSHPALNFGFEGLIPLGRQFSVSVGLEDYFVFWNEEDLGPFMLDILGPVQEGATAIDFLYETSHVLVLRLGASWRP